MAEDVEKIFGKRPWKSRTQEILEAEQPHVDDTVKKMPEVQAAIAEHAKNHQEDENTPKGIQKKEDSPKTDTPEGESETESKPSEDNSQNPAPPQKAGSEEDDTKQV
jgi:hypothetical protein